MEVLTFCLYGGRSLPIQGRRGVLGACRAGVERYTSSYDLGSGAGRSKRNLFGYGPRGLQEPGWRTELADPSRWEVPADRLETRFGPVNDDLLGVLAQASFLWGGALHE